MPINLTRSILVVLIPGVVSVAPLLLLLVAYVPEILSHAGSFSAITNVACFALVCILGLVCESFGTWLEVAWDKEREETYAVKENWHKYLARSVNPEPVGYRYLSRRATTMYFELSMFFASILFCIGAFILSCLYFQKIGYVATVLLFSIAISLFFYINAKKTHEVLCDTRKAINERLDRINSAS